MKKTFVLATALTWMLASTSVYGAEVTGFVAPMQAEIEEINEFDGMPADALVGDGLGDIEHTTLKVGDSGSCGANVKWSFTAGGVLTLSGTGEMTDYYDEYSPFAEATEIKKLVIEDGITYIGISAFLGCRNLYSVTIPASVTSIGFMSFYNCSNLLTYNILNPNVEIGHCALGIYGDNLFSENVSGVTIYGKLNSTAQEYATENGINFKTLAEDVTVKFTDVSSGVWYVEAIQYALDNGIMNGTSATTFEPEKACTRTMMVQILWNAEGKQTPTVSNPFADVKTSDWFYKSVLWAYENKITTGVSATEFGNSDVTREQMARFLMNYAAKKGYDTSARADLSKYEDANQISGWATEAMQWANANGIINGTSATVLNPKGGATRAQVAKMIMNFQKRFGK